MQRRMIPLSAAAQADIEQLDAHLRAVTRTLIHRIVIEPDIGTTHAHGPLRTVGALRVRFDRMIRPERLMEELSTAREGGTFSQPRLRVIYMRHNTTLRREPVELIEFVAIGDAHPEPGQPTVYALAEQRILQRLRTAIR